MPKGDPGRRQVKVDLSLVEVDEYLTGLGIQNISEENNDYRFSCPYPEHSFGDKSPSAYMNKDTTAFICFSCGRAGNAITMLAEIMEVSRTQARFWIAQKWSPTFVEIEEFTAYLMSIMREEEEEHDEILLLPEFCIDERRVDWMAATQGTGGPLKYILDRGFSPEVLAYFEVCYDHYADRPCVTVRDADGRLVGFKGRAWRQDQQPKYLVVGDTERSTAYFGARYGFPPYDASRFVFALDKAKAIGGQLIFCEGELNVIAMHQHGFTNTIGPSGSTVTLEQVSQIIARCEEIVIFMDSDLKDDSSAMLARVKIQKVVDMFEPFVSVRVVADHVGDPATMQSIEIKTLVDEARSAMTMQLMQKMGLTSSPRVGYDDRGIGKLPTTN